MGAVYFFPECAVGGDWVVEHFGVDPAACEVVVVIGVWAAVGHDEIQAFGYGVGFGDVVEALGADVGDLEGEAGCCAGHVDGGAPFCFWKHVGICGMIREGFAKLLPGFAHPKVVAGVAVGAVEAFSVGVGFFGEFGGAGVVVAPCYPVSAAVGIDGGEPFGVGFYVAIFDHAPGLGFSAVEDGAYHVGAEKDGALFGAPGGFYSCVLVVFYC